MVIVKISEMVAADTLTGSELMPVVQGGVNKRTTTQNIADLSTSGAGSQYEDLVGTEWDYATQRKVRVTLTSDTALTLVGTVNGNEGLLHVTQDATGGWALTINGTAINLNTDPDATTLVGFSNINGTLIEYDTNVVSGGAVDLWVTANFDTTTMTEAAGIWAGPNAAWGNYGLETTAIPANQSVRWAAQWFDADNYNSVLILNKTTDLNTIPIASFGVNVPGSDVFFTEYHGGVGTLVPITILASGEWYALFRDGATGDIKLQRSTDKLTWASVYTFAESYTGVLYLYANLFSATNQLANPQHLLL